VVVGVPDIIMTDCIPVAVNLNLKVFGAIFYVTKISVLLNNAVLGLALLLLFSTSPIKFLLFTFLTILSF